MIIHPTLHSQQKRTVLLRRRVDESYITKRTPLIPLDALLPPRLILVLCIMFISRPISIEEQVNYCWTRQIPDSWWKSKGPPSLTMINSLLDTHSSKVHRSSPEYG
jgi:hypothetical protein